MAPWKGLGIWSPEGWAHTLLRASFVTGDEVVAFQNLPFFISTIGDGFIGVSK